MLCPHCGSRSLHFEAADREGRVHSFVHVGFSPFGDFWKDDVPYTVVRVDLDCGVRFMARLVGHDRDAIEIDDQVVMGFAPVRDSDRRVPVFMRVNQTAGISDDE